MGGSGGTVGIREMDEEGVLISPILLNDLSLSSLAKAFAASNDIRLDRGDFCKSE